MWNKFLINPQIHTWFRSADRILNALALSVWIKSACFEQHFTIIFQSVPLMLKHRRTAHSKARCVILWVVDSIFSESLLITNSTHILQGGIPGHNLLFYVTLDYGVPKEGEGGRGSNRFWCIMAGRILKGLDQTLEGLVFEYYTHLYFSCWLLVVTLVVAHLFCYLCYYWKGFKGNVGPRSTSPGLQPLGLLNWDRNASGETKKQTFHWSNIWIKDTSICISYAFLTKSMSIRVSLSASKRADNM